MNAPPGLQRQPTGGGFARIARSPAAVAIGFVWGFAESTLFFIVPDVWVGFVALFARRWAGVVLIAAIVGALAGTIVLWYWTLSGPGAVTRLLLEVPGVTDLDLFRARRELVAQGAPAIALAWLSGIPIKVYTHEAVLVGVSLSDVLPFVALNRLIRIALVTLAAGFVATVFERLVQRYASLVVIAYVAIWLAFYAIYFATRSG